MPIIRGIYRLLLRLQPRRVREEFGAEMLAVFDEAAEAAWAEGWWPRCRFAMRELSGLLVPRGPREQGGGVRLMRWRWPLAGAMAGIAAGFLATWFVPEMYRSVATLRAMNGPMPGNVTALPNPEVTQRVVLSVVPAVLSRHTITNIISTYDLYLSERRRLPMEDIVEIFRRNFQLRMGDHSTLQVVFTYPDRYLAQKVARDVMTRIIDDAAREGQTESVEAVALLRRESEKAARRWEDKIAAARQVKPDALGFERAQLDVELAKRRYVSVEERLAEAEAAAERQSGAMKAGDGGRLEVLDLPSLPERPLVPAWWLVAGFGAGGFTLGLLIGWLSALRRLGGGPGASLVTEMQH